MPAPLSLMALWSRHRRQCRAVVSIVSDARNGNLPGVAPAANGPDFYVVDESAALAAMRKEVA